jgi:hypothetical protein
MILCPICGAKTRVTETRVTERSARRRRLCTVSNCTGRLTTVEVVVPDGRASALASGNIIVSAKHIARLRDLIAQIEGSAL